MLGKKFLIRLWVIATFTTFPMLAAGDVIDSYDAAQGPITVGPGEEPTEEEAVLTTNTVLGGFRVATPAVDDEAAEGSTATLEIIGGVMDCTLEFPNMNTENNNAGCVTGYDRGEGETFDLSGSSQFEVDLGAVNGGFNVAVTIVDTNEDISFGVVENVSAGTVIIPFNTMFNTNNFQSPGVDLTLIDNLSLTVFNSPGSEGFMTVSEFRTNGAIKGGPVVPGDGDVLNATELTGTFFNSIRDGEGCQLTLQRDEVTYILTCYFYKDGEQFWLIGIGVLEGDTIEFAELTITSGTGFGEDFDAAEVIRTAWGSGTMTFEDCNNMILDLIPILEGYEIFSLPMTKLVPSLCGDGGPSDDTAQWIGTYFDPLRDGEGFQITSEAGGTIFILTWYTYLEGKQVWFIGVGVRDEDTVTFEGVVVTEGAGFGSEFDAADVVRINLGTITVTWTDCNNISVNVDSDNEDFTDLDLDMTKIVPGECS